MTKKSLADLSNQGAIHRLQQEDFFYDLIPLKLDITQQDKERILKEFPPPTLPKGAETVSIFQCNAKDTVSGVHAIVDSIERKFAKNNNPFLQFQFTNSKGSFKGKMWDNGSLDDVESRFQMERLVTLRGTVEEFPPNSGNKSITVQSIVPLPSESVSPVELLPTTRFSFEDLILELISYVEQLSDPHRTLILSMLRDHWEQFRIKPAAKWHHHNYLGGLLQHTTEMMRIGWHLTKKSSRPISAAYELIRNLQTIHLKQVASQIVETKDVDFRKLTWNESFDNLNETITNFSLGYQENKMNIDLFLGSIVLHDIGKIFDYTHAGDTNKMRTLFPYASDLAEYDQLYAKTQTGIGMDAIGSSIGHMTTGVLLLNRCLTEHTIHMDVATISEYMHNIMSHHGKIEWGSPIRPSYPSSWLLHFVDILDAKYEKEQMDKKRE